MTKDVQIANYTGELRSVELRSVQVHPAPARLRLCALCLWLCLWLCLCL